MIQVLTGVDVFGDVIVSVNSEDYKNGKNTTGRARYKAKKDKTGHYVTVKGVKHRFEMPQGEWKSRTDGYNGLEWVNA